MIKKYFKTINNLIESKKIDEAQFELSKFGSEFYNNPEYLYLRSKIFFLNRLYYIAVDTLLVALEFEESDRNYELLAKTYDILGNSELSEKFSNPEIRSKAVRELKSELSGIYQKKNKLF